jgi:hypothetical protein
LHCHTKLLRLGEFANAGRDAKRCALGGNEKSTHSHAWFFPAFERVPANHASKVSRLAFQSLGNGDCIGRTTSYALSVKYSHATYPQKKSPASQICKLSWRILGGQIGLTAHDGMAGRRPTRLHHRAATTGSPLAARHSGVAQGRGRRRWLAVLRAAGLLKGCMACPTLARHRRRELRTRPGRRRKQRGNANDSRRAPQNCSAASPVRQMTMPRNIGQGSIRAASDEASHRSVARLST